MRILLAVDDQAYSTQIIPEVANLSANTWADITILSVQTAKGELDNNRAELLRDYKDKFLAQVNDEEGFPYHKPTGKEDFVQVTGGWKGLQPSREGSKSCSLKIRCGVNTYKEIISEAKDLGADLIIMGASLSECQWHSEVLNLPQKVAREAGCSVLVMKQPLATNKLIGCLDQSQVSQESLEMINQLVTLHQADIKIVALTGPKGFSGKGDIEGQMGDILTYYSARNIKAWLQLVEENDLEEYVAKASKEGMVAVWMGKASIFKKLFSQNLVEKLLGSSQSSVLILR